MRMFGLVPVFSYRSLGLIFFCIWFVWRGKHYKYYKGIFSTIYSQGFLVNYNNEMLLPQLYLESVSDALQMMFLVFLLL